MAGSTIALVVCAAVVLSFLSAAGFYVFVGRKKIDGDKKMWDWGFIGSAACLCLLCVCVAVWQLSKGKSNNMSSLNGL